MPQQNTLWAAFKNAAGKIVPALVDSNTNQLLISNGGANPVLNVTAAAPIKAAAGRVGRLIIVSPGSTSGAFTINDCATTGAANAANTIWTLPYNGAANVAGAIIELDFPFTTGLVVSAVPGGSPQISISFT